jgi:hypothetical protein
MLNELFRIGMGIALAVYMAKETAEVKLLRGLLMAAAPFIIATLALAYPGAYTGYSQDCGDFGGPCAGGFVSPWITNMEMRFVVFGGSMLAAYLVARIFYYRYKQP